MEVRRAAHTPRDARIIERFLGAEQEAFTSSSAGDFFSGGGLDLRAPFNPPRHAIREFTASYPPLVILSSSIAGIPVTFSATKWNELLLRDFFNEGGQRNVAPCRG